MSNWWDLYDVKENIPRPKEPENAIYHPEKLVDNDYVSLYRYINIPKIIVNFQNSVSDWWDSKTINNNFVFKLGSIFIQFHIKDKVMKVDAGKLKGIEDNKALKDFLENNDFFNNKLLNGYELAANGKSAIALFKNGNDKYLNFFSVSDYRYSNDGSKKLEMIDLQSLDEQNIRLHFEIVDKKLQVYQIYDLSEDDLKALNGMPFFSNWKDQSTKPNSKIINVSRWYKEFNNEIPVRIMLNRPDGLNDAAGMEDLINMVDFMSSNFQQEMHIQKSKIVIDREQATKSNIVKWLDSVKAGTNSNVYDFFKTNDSLVIELSGYTNHEGRMNSYQIIQPNGAIIAQLMANMFAMLDVLIKYMGGMRDTNTTGANKQTIEVLTFNQYATETIILAKRQRTNDFYQFFKKWGKIINKSFVMPKEIEIENSEIEKLKLAISRSDIKDGKVVNMRNNTIDRDII